jgi:hypothetical protein
MIWIGTSWRHPRSAPQRSTQAGESPGTCYPSDRWWCALMADLPTQLSRRSVAVLVAVVLGVATPLLPAHGHVLGQQASGGSTGSLPEHGRQEPGRVSSSAASGSAGSQDGTTSGVEHNSGSSPWLRRLWTRPTSGFTRADEVRDGTYIYTDPVFDDHGPDTDGETGGDATYPEEGAPYMRNAADLVELRLREAGARSMALGVRLNTLLDRSVPIVAVGIAHHSMAGTARSWPGGAGVRADGIRWVVTLRGGGAFVTDLAQGTRQRLPVEFRNDTRAGRRHLENTLSVRIPTTTLGLHDPMDRWRVVAVAGVRDGRTWYHPQGSAPAPYDLSLTDERSSWGDGTGRGESDWEQSRQADVLASGHIRAASLVVDAGFENRPPGLPIGEATTRIYRPTIEMQTGEGIERNTSLQLVNEAEGTPAGEATTAPLGNYYLGLYLPYSLWIPDSYDQLSKPLPLFVNLHGITGNHQSHLFHNWPNGNFDVPAMAISPLGRSEYGFYQRAAALDVFEALADAKRHLPVDDSRVYLSGFSMGGGGTYTLATQRPDLFAAAIPIAGPGSGTPNFLWPAPTGPLGVVRDHVGLQRMGSYGRELLDNALNVPFRIWHATLDNYVVQTFSEGDAARWEELGYDYQFANFATRTHVIVPDYVNALYHQVLDGCTASSVPGCADPTLRTAPLVRDRNPARVVYKALPSSWAPGIGLRFDGAYWVSRMRARDNSTNDKFGRVDATSFALAHKLRRPAQALGPELRTFSATGDRYRFQARRWTDAPAQRTNAFEARLQNLAAITLDLARMGIATRRPVRMTISGDGTTTVTLSGADTRIRYRLIRDGAPLATIRARNGHLSLTRDWSGNHVYTLRPVRASGSFQ